MYPVYRYTEPYPQPVSHQSNHIPYPYHYNPSWEVIPPQVKRDPAESPAATLKPWPYGGSLTYPNPTECHGCCNHGYPGYYSYQPPHTYVPPYPPVYHCGPYPPHHDAYAPYFVPPQHYSADQARYEYDKNMDRDHCCGCPNHTCNGKADSKVKIEEEKPDLERKGSDSNGMIKLQNYPRPIIWMPPGYMKDKETAKPSEIDSKVRNGWVPLDLNSRSLNKGGDEKRIKDQQTDDRKSQLQWPIIWLPGYDNADKVEKKDVKDIEESPKVTEGAPSKFKITPVKLLENENCGQKPGVVEDASGNGPSSNVAEKGIKPKSGVAEEEMKAKNIVVKQIEENGEKKLENTSKKQSSSHVKTSKLPPVCLRVDPLPKKKNGKGTSRSPSPPKKQEPVVEKEGESKNKATKVGNLVEKPSQINEGKERQPKIREIKVVDAEEKPSPISDTTGGLPEEEDTQVVRVEKKMATHTDSVKAVTQESNVMRNETDERCRVNSPMNLTEEVEPVIEKAERDGRAHEKTEGVEDKKKAMRKILSNVEAAVLIQSAYRGFEVRRWEPLKKLRQIDRIRKQVADVREQIQDLERFAKMQLDKKTRIVINETIMSLLLQLDTIQGLHPDVREIRKSVARELVCLQEKLDSLAIQTTNEEFQREKACRENDGSVLAESTPDAVQSAEQLISGIVASDVGQSKKEDEGAVTSCVEEQPEIEPKEIFEMPSVDANVSEAKLEEATDHLTSVERELSEVHNGMHSSEVDVLISSPPPVNVEPREDLIELDAIRDEERDSAVHDELVKSFTSDGSLDSAVEKISEDALTVEDEAAAPTLQQFSSVKDDQVEELVESQERNGELNSMSLSPKSLSTGDECVDSGKEEASLEKNKVSEMGPEVADSASTVKVENDYKQHVEAPSATPELEEKDAECKLVETEKSLGHTETLLFSDSNINRVAEPVTPELAYQVNNVDVSGGANWSDAEAYDLVPEEMGETNFEQRYSEEDRIASPSQEGWHSNSDIFKETTVLQEAGGAIEAEPSPVTCEVINLPQEAENTELPCVIETPVDVAAAEAKSHEPLFVPEAVVEHPPSAVNDPVQDCHVDPLAPGEVEERKEDKDMAGDNEKLKAMLEKLLEAGKQQVSVISDLNDRVKDLEKLVKKKMKKIRRRKAAGSSCIKHTDNQLHRKASLASVV